MKDRAIERLRDRLCAALQAHLAGELLDLPEGGVVLWNAFAALSAARNWHPIGPNPFGFAEIEAWSRLMRQPLEPHHVAILRAMDDAWLEAKIEELRQAKAGPSRRKPAAPLTAEMFDHVFG